MNNSSRASPPPPLNLATLPSNTFDMEKSRSAESEAASIPTTASRSASYSSECSITSSPPSLRKSSTGFIRSSAPVNVHTTCGRHTDQFFFSGPSLKDLAKSIKKKF